MQWDSCTGLKQEAAHVTAQSHYRAYSSPAIVLKSLPIPIRYNNNVLFIICQQILGFLNSWCMLGSLPQKLLGVNYTISKHELKGWQPLFYHFIQVIIQCLLLVINILCTIINEVKRAEGKLQASAVLFHFNFFPDNSFSIYENTPQVNGTQITQWHRSAQPSGREQCL